jgi:hypothetical protein
VILGSSWRRDPAAALRGLANGGRSSEISLSFNSSNASTRMMISPRTASAAGAGRTSSRRRSGMERMVRAFSVMPSPRIPSPRVEARTRRPFSYTSSIDKPSSFGSTTHAARDGSSRPRSTRSVNRRSASSVWSESRLSIGASCCTEGNEVSGSPPTRCVGESGVRRSGKISSRDCNSRNRKSYSASDSSGESST